MIKVWWDRAWEDLEFWLENDRKTVSRIRKLLNNIDNKGNCTVGKVENLKGNYAGCKSLRIDDKNRLIYRIADGKIEILHCRKHYDDH